MLLKGAMLYMYVEDVDAVYNKAIQAGAKSITEPADQFWGDRSGAPPPSSDIASLDAFEREHILRVLTETNWIVGGPNGAAARLEMKRTTLQARMKKLGISRR